MDNDPVLDRPVVVGIADKQPALLEYAKLDAQRAGCGIKLVHAFAVPPTALGSFYGVDIPESYRAGGNDVLAEARHQLAKDGATPPVESVLIQGYAPSVLESASRSARVVIIGPDESKPWYVRLFEGRVARHLASHAGCPVVVVPDTWQRSDDSGGPIVVMIDGEDSAHGPLKYAFDTASTRGADLKVLHVASPDEGAFDAQWEVIRRVVDSWFDRHPEVHGVSQTVKGGVRETAVEAAEGASLLIVGRPHERRIVGFLMDLVAQEILAEAGCPVAVVPGGYRG